ncbi:Protein kinase C-like, phorbol ester/diacylglycerol binding protein [Corchorus olitorius]|uniref:Protein kinase C-like, phorbol ester/diacylglycerol binding protein n=1 Tax=Corchorus olitorius TaxID=93759 RepID=A0A1R3JGM8_9ROSI|nr:Protein kinase C-like, phorbol ester/diacylglycerol binding protein [Corchorus olitorius]
MESQDLGHEHPLIFNEEQNKSAANCSRCGEAMSGRSLRCAEECGFYVHKQCAEAPLQINHPFHRDHPLLLLPNPPATAPYEGVYLCSFCGERGTMSVYRCSCYIDLHIKCALLTYNFAENKLALGDELQPIASYKDPPSIGNNDNGMEQVVESTAKCFGCWEPLLDPHVYCSIDSGFKLHKKCVELPREINHPFHCKHPLILQFNSEIFSCAICVDTRGAFGFCYHCSPCDFTIHIACLTSPSPPPIIQDKHHPHPFTQFSRDSPFTCDACGTDQKGGPPFPYLCLECNLLLHKECISLPRVIEFFWHPQHPIFHTYFLPLQGKESWECVVCLDKVDTCYGSYSCLHCHFIVHVNCVMKHMGWWCEEIDPEKYKDGKFTSDSDDTSMESSMIVLERNEDGEATQIQHFSHQHNLIMLSSDDINNKYCNGCALSISVSGDPVYYHCSQSQCDFVLHKTYAEFPKKKHFWFHYNCWQPSILVLDKIFRCRLCRFVCNDDFAYQCEQCKDFKCLRCVIPNDTLKCQGHQHPLFFKLDHRGRCDACGGPVYGGEAFKCKKCNDFAFDHRCLLLPHKGPHKCDEHLLTLTYYDDNTYSLTHFCDICEQHRDPSLWFYHCAICDTYAHPNCVFERGRYPFMKPGKIYKQSDRLHQHDLIFVIRRSIIIFLNALSAVIPVKNWLLSMSTLNADALSTGNVLHLVIY